MRSLLFKPFEEDISCLNFKNLLDLAYNGKMAIKTLMKDHLHSLEIIIERSDKGRLFFGAIRNDPKIKACYTFDMAKTPGMLLELVREAQVKSDDGQMQHVDFDITIDTKRHIVSCSSRSHPKNPAKAAEEIERAYRFVSMYQKHFLTTPNNKRLYPEVSEYLERIISYPFNTFREKYGFI